MSKHSNISEETAAMQRREALDERPQDRYVGRLKFQFCRICGSRDGMQAVHRDMMERCACIRRTAAGKERITMTATRNDLIAELQQRCPGCTFSVTANPPKVRIVEYGRKFTVDLTSLGETAEEWFKKEIEAHSLDDAPPLQPDEKYKVICKNCGPVVLGYGRYRDQLARPDTGWFCPICGGFAMFDDETYENYLGENDEQK